ncbi:LysR family transcriptional regulator [Vibrio cholerae]
MDKMDGLRAFVATAQTGSFTAAAQRLGISNRLTSKYVAQLEAQVGARLLQRTTRNVSVTSAGLRLLEQAPRLLAEFDELFEQVGRSHQQLSGPLKISAPITFGELYLQDLLRRFALLHPEIELDLRLTDDFVDLAMEGFDLAFRIGLPDNASVRGRKLGIIHSQLVASTEYLADHGTPISIDDLAQHRLIIDTNRQGYQRWTFTREGVQSDFKPRSQLKVNSARVAKEWAEQGMGIALCPDFVTHDGIKSGRLVRVLDDYDLGTRSMYAIYLAGHEIPRKVRALIDFAHQELSSTI